MSSEWFRHHPHVLFNTSRDHFTFLLPGSRGVNRTRKAFKPKPVCL